MIYRSSDHRRGAVDLGGADGRGRAHGADAAGDGADAAVGSGYGRWHTGHTGAGNTGTNWSFLRWARHLRRA